jgi:hypothetical protein
MTNLQWSEHYCTVTCDLAKLLTKVCTTVGTTPVLQSKAAQNSKRKKENCTEYAKTSKIIFQNSYL